MQTRTDSTKHLISHSVVNFHVNNKLLCSERLLHFSTGWQSDWVRLDSDLPWTAPPKLKDVKSDIKRWVETWSVPSGSSDFNSMAAGPEWWESEGEMRWKLNGGMAHSAVILPQATSYADPVRPGLGTRLLGKHGVFPPFRVMFYSVPLPRSSIHTSTRKINLQVHIRRNMHAWMLTEEESYWIIQMQMR